MKKTIFKRMIIISLCISTCFTFYACSSEDIASEAVTTEETKSIEAEQEVTVPEFEDEELQRAYKYGFFEEKWMENQEADISFGEYYQVLEKIVLAYSPDKIEEWKAVLSDATDNKETVSVADALMMTYITAWSMDISAFSTEDNFETVMNSIDQNNGWEVWGEPGIEYHINEENLFVNRYPEQINWGLVGNTIFCLTNRISPYSGNAVFEIPGISAFPDLSQNISVDMALRMATRLYDTVYIEEIDETQSEEAAAILEAAEVRKQEILNTKTEAECTGTAYYVSNEGNDVNDGLTPETAWASYERIMKEELKAGDVVYFNRGDVFRGTLCAQEGVTYSAYGEGNKPILTGSPENGAGKEKWELYYEDESGKKIWKYYRTTHGYGSIMADGQMDVFLKTYARYKNETYFVMNQTEAETDTQFEITENLENMHFFTTADKNADLFNEGVIQKFEDDSEWAGELYIRCDEGNPGERYQSIEFSSQNYCIQTEENTVYDNLSIILAQGSFTSARGNFVVQNCELAYHGGGICSHDEYGVPLIGGESITLLSSKSVVRNCYMHDSYDNGAGLEMIPEHGSYKDCVYDNNVIEYCNGGFLFARWFGGSEDEDAFQNINIYNNYVLYCGYGWGNGEHLFSSMGTSSAFNNGGNKTVTFQNINVENNVFYLSKECLLAFPSETGQTPLFSGNTYVQATGALMLEFYDSQEQMMYYYGKEDLDLIKSKVNDATGTYLYLE